MTDIVICFYNEFDIWPQVAWGLRENSVDISKVIIARDGEWTEEEEERLLMEIPYMPAQFTGHPHKGCNTGLTLNEGARCVNTPHFIHIDADIVLLPGAVRKMAMDVDDGILLLGHAHDVARNLPCLDLIKGDVKVLRHDTRRGLLRPPVERFADVRDLFLCCKTDDYWRVGGHHEDMVGYGFTDYEYAFRWLTTFGADSIEYGRGEAYHLGGSERSTPFSPSNKAIFEEAFAKWKQHLAQTNT